MSLRTESGNELTAEELETLCVEAREEIAAAYAGCKLRCASAKAPNLIAPGAYEKLRKYQRLLSLKLKEQGK